LSRRQRDDTIDVVVLPLIADQRVFVRIAADVFDRFGLLGVVLVGSAAGVSAGSAPVNRLA
jgi:hypothetical protein